MNIIDVRQFVTQIIGFLIVLWVLGRYAWPPVLGFIEARQKGIAADLDHAAAERRDAARLKEELERELRTIEARARARIQEAVSEGQQLAAELKSSTQREVTERLERLAAELEQEREKATFELKQDLVRLAIGAAEKVVREKLDEKTSRKLVEEFIAEVGAAPPEAGARG
jgi:F-type H+-transporting ATPase subunit b